MGKFKMTSTMQPAGDQEAAIRQLCDGLETGMNFQTLMGVTGSGKTFSMAKVIEHWQRPTLVLSHNKTLAAQLYREFKEFFNENAVEYFVSYFDYYQPEAYIASRDLYIEKDSSINSEIERMRLSATANLLERRDVIVVATVSCIYGLGSPRDYWDMKLRLECGMEIDINQLKQRLIELQYERNDDAPDRGAFRVKGDVLEIWAADREEVYRVEFDWDRIEQIRTIHGITGTPIKTHETLVIYPAKHFVISESKIKEALTLIREEMEERCSYFTKNGQLVEAQRLRARTLYDLEMLAEVGYCQGIENYSRHLSGRKEGEPPAVLLDYFPDEFLTIIDESHVSLPQVRAMYGGDRARKKALIDFGFRLPSAFDNRPLQEDEFKLRLGPTVFVSATPSDEEKNKSMQIVEQIIRPTGLLDPSIIVRPVEGQIEDLCGEVNRRVAANERILITTLTKKMAEHLSEYLSGIGMKVQYIHSEVDTLERVEILMQLRNGEFDVLVGINLLREGLDLPEVSLVIILDADKIGFLRSHTSLIQTIGRAARNLNGTVIMYADRVSTAMSTAIEETERRRAIQSRYNEEHNIQPQSIQKAVTTMLVRDREDKKENIHYTIDVMKSQYNSLIGSQRKQLITKLQQMMMEHAKKWEFEEAAAIKQEIEKLKNRNISPPNRKPVQYVQK